MPATLRQLLHAMTEVVIPEDGLDEERERVATYLAEHGPQISPEQWPGIVELLERAEQECLEQTGEAFTETGPAERGHFLRELDPALVEPIAEMICLCHYGAPGWSPGEPLPAAWEMLGYPPPPAPSSAGRLPAVTRRLEDLTSGGGGTFYDVVVVGSGAGGGTAARVLAQAGARVLLIERGKALDAHHVGADHLRNHRLAAWGHNTGPDLEGNPRLCEVDGTDIVARPHEGPWNNNAMALGGGTRVWGAQAWRFSPTDFVMASTYGVPEGSSLADWPIGYEDLEPYYSAVEQAMGVAGEAGHVHMGHRSNPYPMPPLAPGPASRRLAEGAQRLGWPVGAVPLMVNSVPYGGRDACVRCSQCIGFACPVDARGAPFNTVLAGAGLPGTGATGTGPAGTGPAGTGLLTVLVGTRVLQVLHQGGLATGVRARAEDGSGSVQDVATGAVVVAAGAIETARLLLVSGLGGPATGLNLQGHTYVGALGLFDEPITDLRGPGPSVATCRFLHANPGVVGGGMLADEFVKTPAAFWSTSLPPGAPKWGPGAAGAMRHAYKRTAHVMGPVQEIPNPGARVTLAPIADSLGMPVAALRGHSHPDDRHSAHMLAERAYEWMEASGASRIWTWPAPRQVPRLSAGQHQAGTCRMGESPATSVCNPWGSLHDCANVVLADASVHVTNGGVNPALTVMALAWRNAEALANRL
ncbi:MAG TPA: GMC family oxidoreductase [Acidimicrobiales bacterium]|nr:GMC family oxidoreductase [Acidimicrobiales bacterium]